MDEVAEAIDNILQIYQCNLEDLPNMLDDLCGMYPDIDRRDFEIELDLRLLPPSAQTTIPQEDLQDAMQVGNGDIDSTIDYLLELHPTLTREDVDDALKSLEKDAGEGTPTAKEGAYQPSDFSPSSMGACSIEVMDFLKAKRAKHLPDYVSPPRTPRSANQSSRKRFHNQLKHQPKAPANEEEEIKKQRYSSPDR